ncbi:MAG TPA: MFS transporter [Clostridia bacterium]|nr:MFS transporter [Clostridia bacterium]
MIRGATFATAAIDRRLALTLPLAIGGVQIVAGGVDLLLAAALDRIDPGARVTTFGWITAVGALLAMLLYPLAGMASDRTSRRFGRRSAWVLVGAAGSACGLVALGLAGSTPALGFGFVVAVAFVPVVVVPLYASIADRIREGSRGAVGALVGAATIVGGVLGNVIAARLADRTLTAAAVFGAILLGGAVAVALFGGEDRGDPAASEPLAGGQVPGGQPPGGRPLDPAASATRRDLAWFSVARFGLFLGYAMVAMLAYYILRDHLGHPDPVSGVAAFAVVSGGATLLGSLVAGPWSDRRGRRRPFVAGSAAILAAGLVLPAVLPGFPAFLVAGALIGLGFGAYLAVGTALGTLVLPRASTAGRDIGLIGLANATAQAVAPLTGSYLAASFGYPVLFVGAAAASLAAAFAVQRIRGVA